MHDSSISLATALLVLTHQYPLEVWFFIDDKFFSNYKLDRIWFYVQPMLLTNGNNTECPS